MNRLSNEAMHTIIDATVHSQGLLGRIESRELEKHVWSKSLADIGALYGVCDQTVRRECLRRGIPTPPSGWSQSELINANRGPDTLLIAKRKAWSEISTEELDLLLQNHTGVAIGAMFGISSSAVKKKANKLKLHTKPRGYWGHNQFS